MPISAADVAKMMEAMGIDRVCCVDLHCGQIQGFFGPRTPVDNLYATPIAIGYFQTRQLQNVVVVSPDAGGVALAKMFQEGLEATGMRASLAMIIPRTRVAQDSGLERMVVDLDLVGRVSGCDCIIVDDMIDTANTLCVAANELTSLGARRVFAFATHGLFSGSAAETIEGSSLEEVVVTNTIPLSPSVQRDTRKVRQVSVSPQHACAHYDALTPHRCARYLWASCSRRRSTASTRATRSAGCSIRAKERRCWREEEQIEGTETASAAVDRAATALQPRCYRRTQSRTTELCSSATHR